MRILWWVYYAHAWPIMALFAIGLILTFLNFYKTVANRKLSEIYISNWFILASLIWTIVLSIIGYFPTYQDGLGETVIQGYYMHQGVGMWFMTFTLGLVYYFLPSTLNKPIYSYSLGTYYYFPNSWPDSVTVIDLVLVPLQISRALVNVRLPLQKYNVWFTNQL